MSRPGAPPRRSTGPVRAVGAQAADPAAPPSGERRVVRPSPLGPRWRATPVVLAAWSALAAIVVAGQVLAPGRRAGGAVRHGASSTPALVTGIRPTAAPTAPSSVAAPSTPWYDALGAPRPPLVAPAAMGPLAAGAASPLAAAGTRPPAGASTAPAAAVVGAGTRASTAATPDAPTSAERTSVRPRLPFLGGEHRFENPLLMPRLRDGLKVKLPHLAKLPTVGRLFTRPSPGEPVPVLITAYCLQGTTRRGNLVRTGIVAADPRVFPLARHVELYAGGRFLGRFLVDDTGGKIKGQRIDIWTPDCADALRFGARRGVATLVAISEGR